MPQCKHPDAPEAFSKLKEAVTILQDEDRKKFYLKIVEVATTEVETELGRKERGDNDETFKKKRSIACQKLIMDAEKQLKHSQDMKTKNDLYDKQKEAEILKQAEKEREWQKKWNENLEERGASWHTFVKKKKVESEGSQQDTNQKKTSQKSVFGDLLGNDNKKKKKVGRTPLKPPKLNLQK